MATIEEINQLVAEYNAAEEEQHARRLALFVAINDRKNYRRVVFANGHMWSNCWNRPLRLILPPMVDTMRAVITEVEPGAE